MITIGIFELIMCVGLVIFLVMSYIFFDKFLDSVIYGDISFSCILFIIYSLLILSVFVNFIFDKDKFFFDNNCNNNCCCNINYIEIKEFDK